MTLHGNPLEEVVTVPDGRDVLVRVGIARDPYVAERELDTIDVELFESDRLIAVVNTVLSADDDAAAGDLMRDLIAGLGSGDIEPTAAGVEPFADRGVE